MIKKSVYLQLFLYLALCQNVFAQKTHDSLRKQSYTYLEESIDRNERDTIRVWLYLNAGLAKAKADKNWGKITKSYENMAYFSTGDQDLVYADSMITASKKTNSDDIAASAYLTKGNIYYGKKQYLNALDNYILANNYIGETKDDHLKNKVKYHIATIKIYLGFYSEAEVLIRQCTDYFKKTDPDGYINSLHALSICYNKLEKYDLCTATNELGLKITKNIDSTDRSYFIHSEGINQYCKGNYAASIEKINSALPLISKNGDFANEAVGNFYIGKSYMALGNRDNALNYFRKVDRTFSERDYIRPDLREGFEILINYYKDQGNTKVQLHYINKLLRADSILDRNFKYLSGKMHKEYDTRQLQHAKREMEQELASSESTTNILYLAVTVLFFLVLFLLYRYYINQRTYREKFEQLMFTKDEPQQAAALNQEEKPGNRKPDINPEVIASIIKQLEKFEVQKKFLQKDLTLVNLAAAFSTNANYLSRTINYTRNKNYITFLNDLRIDYIVDLLKNDSKYRNYTIKALAEEAGFSTAQHFSKAFYARTGIYPSYFVNELSREYNIFSFV
jgi:AraC-like DNA-binding protein